MRKRKEKAMRRLMALLAAICILGNMPYTSFVVSAEETVSGNELILEQSEEENEDQAQVSDTESKTKDGEDTEVTEDTDSDDTGDEKDTYDEPDDSEETEEPEDSDDEKTESEESKGTDTEDSGEELENETDVEDSGEDEDVDADADAEESDLTEELEDEDSEESVMLLSAEDEISAVAEQETDSIYTDEKTGVKYHYFGYDDGTANIYELEDFSEPYSKGKVINIPGKIGRYTVTQITFSMTATYSFPSVTIPETVTYIGKYAFRFAKIDQLYYNAVDATTGATNDSGGCFAYGTVKELNIGQNVKVIPNALFAHTTITLDNLTLDVEEIGPYAFYRYTTVTDLTFGENIKEIGTYAFGFDDITNVYFNAIECKNAGGSITGPFNLGSVSNITFGDKVTVIPASLLASISFTADKLEIPESVTEIGAYAFYGTGTTIGEVTIAENITSIGQEAFSLGSIGELHYNAVEAEIPGMEVSLHHRNPFGRVKIGELHIGDKVRVLPDGLFNKVTLAQDELILPDSVTYIGYEVLSYANDAYADGKITIGSLVIGENVSYIGRAAFGEATIDKAAIHAVNTGNNLLTYPREVPTCGSVEIHGNADCYDFFTTNTEADNITLLCEDFETTYGDEYFDEDTSTFVTQVTDTCTVCGYEVESEEYVDGYTVIFEDYDGRELSRQHVKSGADATAPKEPERTGYEFTGWDKSYIGVTSDVTVRAQYKIQTFHVVFKDGEKTISDQEIDYGGCANPPENPTRPDEEWGSWKFTGWEGNYENVMKDEVVQAQFEKVMNKYEVIFYDADGEELSRQTVTHGEAAELPEAPEKESTPQYSYTFKGWDGDTDNITGNVSFHPVYESKIRSYTVTFMNGSDEVDKQTVEYSGNANLPKDPTRPAEEWGTWKFIGWEGNYENIEKDEIVRAQFEKVMNQYEVIFYDADGEELSRQTVTHGEAAELPEAPKKESTPQYSYTFKGWDGDTDNITGNVNFHPVYESKIRSYTVKFMDGSTELDKQTVEYGGSANLPKDPTRPAEEWGTWKFTGWEGNYENIEKDEVVQAQFEKVMNKYEVIFYDAEGKELSRQTITHGEAAETPEAPKKESTPQYDYTFKGWDGDTDNITGNVNFHPVYESKIRSYTVKFMDGSTELDKQTVEYGGSANLPKDPTRPAEEWGTWKFTGWEGIYENIEKDEIILAQFEKVKYEYEVIFHDADGNELSRQKVKHGEAAEIPEAPVKEPTLENSFIFKGWDGDADNITGDVSFYPVYETKARTYTVTFMSGDQVVDEQDVEYGQAATAPSDPVKEADSKYTYTFTGWEGDYSFITEDTVIYALFEKHEIPGTEDKGNGGESEQKEPEPENQDNGANPGDDGELDQGTDGGTETGSPDIGINNNGEDKTGKPEIGIEEQLFRETMPTQDTSDRVSDGTAAVTEEESAEECEEPVIVGNTDDAGNTDEAETAQDLTDSDKEETGRDNGWLKWLMLLLSMTVAGAFLIWLFLILRNRKVYGIILNEDGSPMCGAKITMIGKDMPEAETDENGSFCIDGLKKDDYRMKVTHKEGYLLLSLNIFMESEDKEETFSILESCCSSVETGEKNRKYEINVTA